MVRFMINAQLHKLRGSSSLECLGIERTTMESPFQLDSDSESISRKTIITMSSEESSIEITECNATNGQGYESEERVFHPFTHLPIKIRTLILSIAFPPRVVNIIYDIVQDRYFSFNSSVPKVPHINRESRQMALKTHQLCFGTHSHEPRIYFDIHKDILLFDDSLQCRGGPASRYFEGPNTQSKLLYFDEWPMMNGEEQVIERIAINVSFVGQSVNKGLKFIDQ